MNILVRCAWDPSNLAHPLSHVAEPGRASLLFDAGLFLLGLLLLFIGGELFVRGAVSLANRLSLPPLIIGLTVVGFGTSTPELLVSVEAALLGSPDIAVGNVVGSNTANILLILGLSALISPMATRIAGLRRDIAVLIAVAVLMLGLGFLEVVGRIAGTAMLTLLAAYVIYAVLSGRRGQPPDAEMAIHMPGWREAAAIVGGLSMLIVGADFLVDSSTRIARLIGVSEAVIGLTVVAVGTSLPELATSVIAAFRRHSEVALGNVVGSNIFNILGVLGVTAIVQPVPIARQIAIFDIPLMLAATFAIAVVILILGQMTRGTAVVLLGVYAGYVVFLF